ncbi:hypothetical protein [Actinomadura macra]|uniref:hypothetical protein n=1 Tax=Actinomadura macra TaxID=46164 RepID=UPI0008370579|nr:hypothetical protein [Actinomadura macra]
MTPRNPGIRIGGDFAGQLVVGDHNQVISGSDGAAHDLRGEPHRATSGPSVHHTIVCVDVAKFGDDRRTTPHQVAVRDGLYRALHTAFDRSGADWGDCYHEDRGDGALVLVPSEVPKARLSAGLPPALTAALDEHNQIHAEESRIRLRLALHAGEVRHDAQGATGNALTHAFRLLDAPAIKEALDASPHVLAVIASDWFFEEVIRHDPASSPGLYGRAEITVKETRAPAWLRPVSPGPRT